MSVFRAISTAKGTMLDNERAGQVSNTTSTEDHQETALQAIRNQPRVFFWCVYAIFVLVLTSFDNQAGSIALGIPEFRKDFGFSYKGDYVLPAQWQSAYSGAPVASAIIRSITAGYISDKIGRKLMYCVCFVFIFVAITLETVATTNELFFGGKFMAGFAIGAFVTNSMTYIGEVAPFALRGILTAAAAIAFTMGPFVAALIVDGTGSQGNRWAYRSIFVAQYGFSGAGALLLPFLPESPWWLVSRGKSTKATHSLARLGHSAEEIEERLGIIVVTFRELNEETNGVTYLECFTKSNLRRTIISVAPLSIQALSGIFFVAAYSTYYQQLAGYSTSESFRLSICQQVLSMVGNITSWFLIDRVGRRSLTLWGLIFLTVLLFVTGGLACVGTPAATKGTVALLLLYCYAYNVTIGATAYTLLTEVATARLRAKTASLALALQNSLFTMWAFVIPYLFNPNEANLGAKVSFIFGGFSILAVVYLFSYQPETAGRSYEELDEMFIKRVPARDFAQYKTDVGRSGTRAQQNPGTA